MSPDDFISVGISQQNGNQIRPVPFHGLSGYAGQLCQLRNGKFAVLYQVFQQPGMSPGSLQHFVACPEGTVLPGAVIRHIRQTDAILRQIPSELIQLLPGSRSHIPQLDSVFLIRRYFQ